MSSGVNNARANAAPFATASNFFNQRLPQTGFVDHHDRIKLPSLSQQLLKT
jgi:hypothetical protein